MNSFFTIEINNFLAEYVRRNPITNNPSLDQRLVIVAVSFISTYLIVVILQIKNYIVELYKPKYLYFDHENDNIAHIHIKCNTTIYNILKKYELKLPENLTIADKFTKKNKYNDKKISFCIVPNGNDAKQPWSLLKAKALLPIDENIEQINSDIKNLVRTRYIIYNDYNIMLAVFTHKLNDGNSYYYYHFFVEKKPNDSIETIYEIINKILIDANNYYNKEMSKKQFDNYILYEIRNKKWVDIQTLEPKSNSTIIGETSRDIFKDINSFQTELIDIYKTLDIPYKRGYLLYGPPGCGKTSIIKSIASYLKKNIYKITFNEYDLDDNDYKILFNETPVNSIILIEDVDPKLLSEGGFIEKSSTKSTSNGNNTETTINKKRVSYNTLLDALDGINSNTGRITFITTNHPDKIGDALLRPGRIDRKFKLDYASNEDILEYFILFYTYFKIDKKIINDLANEFIKQIRNYEYGSKITIAELQQYLIQFTSNTDKMLSNIKYFKSNETFESYAS